MMTAFFSAQAKAPPAAAPVLPVFAPPPIRQRNQSLVTFPLPTPAIEVQRFLEDFRRLKGIDIIDCRAVLEASALTPDILSHLTLSRVTELTGLQEGHAIKLQIFGKQWAVSLEEARLADGSV
jgi:hypothetical protein